MSEAHDFGGSCCLGVGIGFVFDFHVCGWNDHWAVETKLNEMLGRSISRAIARGINISFVVLSKQ
jgi:hypothetical protein